MYMLPLLQDINIVKYVDRELTISKAYYNDVVGSIRLGYDVALFGGRFQILQRKMTSLFPFGQIAFRHIP